MRPTGRAAFTGSASSVVAFPGPTTDQWIGTPPPRDPGTTLPGRDPGPPAPGRGGVLKRAVLDQLGEQSAVVAVVDLLGH